MMKNGKMVILIAPSGGGKSSLLNRFLKDRSDFVPIVTYTTRSKREGEVEGQAYHYVSNEKFIELRDQGFFVEWAQVHTNFYGTPRDQIEEAWSQGKNVILDVDVQGADQLKKEFSHAFALFITPPSVDELRRRVRQRDGENAKDLEIRMQNAKNELERADDFDGRLINADFEESYSQFQKIIDEYLKSS